MFILKITTNKTNTQDNLNSDSQIVVSQTESDNIQNSTEDIVVFHDDAGVKITDVIHSEEQNLDFLNGNSVDLSIITFLERPKVFATGNFISTDVYGQIGGIPSVPYLLPSAFINPNSLVADKLQGVQGIKYDLEMTIVVNATRFAQGLYGLYFVYTGGLAPDLATEWFNPHAATFVQRSQLLHTTFDLSCDTKAVLKIPWMNSLTFTPVSSFIKSIVWDDGIRATGNLGYFFIAPVTNSTAIKPATESANFTVYQRMTNIKLYGAAAMPQMFSLKEAKSKNMGPIESTTVKLNTLLGRFSKNPLLSSYVTPLKWVNDIVKDTSSVFGWARPNNLSTMARIKRKPMANVGQVDDTDNSDTMGFSASNSVAVMPSFTYSGLDELDFKNFCSRFTIIDSFDFSLTSSGTIYQRDLAPDHFKVVSSGLTSHSNISYLSSLFRQWRGSIVVRLTIVRTEFHSGRLEVSFNPRYNISPQTNTYDFMQRDIIDIREHNQVTLTFPFSSPLMYLPCIDTGAGLDISNSFGDINIRVIDQLRAPTMVSSSVTILVEVAGGDDIEFAGPRTIREKPRIDVIPQMESIDCMLLNKTVGATNRLSETNVPSSLAVGEKITNLRLLLKRFTSISNTADLAVVGANNFVIRPKVISWYDQGAGIVSSNDPDLFTHLGSIFALTRGGTRIKYINPIPRAKLAGTSTFKPLGYVSYYWNYVINQPNLQSAHIWFPVVNPIASLKNLISNTVLFFNPCEEFGVEFTVPQYSLNHSIPCGFMRAGGRYVFPQHTVNPASFQPCVQVVDNSLEDYSLADSNTAQPVLMRAGAEDTNFGGFVSIPPMVTLSGSL